MGACRLGFRQEGPVGTEVTTIGTGSRGHATAFVGELRRTGLAEQRHVLVGGNLPFESALRELVHRFSVARDHVTGVKFSHQTDRVGKVDRMPADLKRQELLVKLEQHPRTLVQIDLVVLVVLGILTMSQDAILDGVLTVAKLQGEVGGGQLHVVQVKVILVEFQSVVTNPHGHGLNVREVVLNRGTGVQVKTDSAVEILGMDHNNITFTVERVVLLSPTLEMRVPSTTGIIIGSSGGGCDGGCGG